MKDTSSQIKEVLCIEIKWTVQESDHSKAEDKIKRNSHMDKS